MRLVNHVDLETYVAAVVTSEYGLDDLEGNKAMAVLARTYALRALGKYGDDYDHVDHSLSQVYHGVGDLKPQAIEGALATRGKVLTYEGALIEAVYHAESGGHTADNETVWSGGKPITYLRGVSDPFANQSPYASWTYRASRVKLLGALSRKYGGRVTGIRIGERSSDGRVATLHLLRRPKDLEVPANEFRLLFLTTFGQYSLKSTNFSARRDGGYYLFEGTGFGHGVGVSQWGAHEMAGRGFGYEDILKFYLRGTTVESLADVSGPGLLAHVTGEDGPPRGNLPAPVLRLPEDGADPQSRAGTPDTPPTKEKRRRKGRRLGW
jgi:stage II sporulation protein D